MDWVAVFAWVVIVTFCTMAFVLMGVFVASLLDVPFGVGLLVVILVEILITWCVVHRLR